MADQPREKEMRHHMIDETEFELSVLRNPIKGTPGDSLGGVV